MQARGKLLEQASAIHPASAEVIDAQERLAMEWLQNARGSQLAGSLKEIAEKGLAGALARCRRGEGGALCGPAGAQGMGGLPAVAPGSGGARSHATLSPGDRNRPRQRLRPHDVGLRDPEEGWGCYKANKPAEAGYACLLVAVLVLGLDHVFMISGTWIRYINAMTKIRTVILKAEFEWARMKSSMASDGAAHEQRDKAYELFQRLVLDSRKVIEDETSAWGSELGQAFQKLEGLVKEQRVGLETLHKEEKKTREEAENAAGAPTTGGVTVDIDKIEKLQGAITVAVDEHVIERSMPIHRVVFPEGTGGTARSYANGDRCERKAGAG